MKLSNLKAAIAEADRFIKLAEKVTDEHCKPGPKPREYIDGSKHTAAARRASMDLTRALSTLRNDR